MKKNIVNSHRGDYPVYTGNSLIENISEILRELIIPGNVFVVMDKKVHKLHGKKIRKALSGFKGKIKYILLPAGEKSKSLVIIEKIFRELTKNNSGKDTLLISVGGGTIGDTAGFAASAYMRGLKLIHIPTTLLSAVDSSIGGKTGVNFQNKKNLIGSFYPPAAVFIDTDFLKTLTKKDLMSGLGEVIKYGLLSNEIFFNFLYKYWNKILSLEKPVINKTIYECVAIKAAIVSKDEFEKSGARKILNLGHTFAHAFESYYNFRVDHGKAVTAGIVASLFLSNKISLIGKEKLLELLSLPYFFKANLIKPDYESRAIIHLMRSDKKNKDGKINFVLLKDIGEVLIDVNVSRNDIVYSLEKLREFMIGFKR